MGHGIRINTLGTQVRLSLSILGIFVAMFVPFFLDGYTQSPRWQSTAAWSIILAATLFVLVLIRDWLRVVYSYMVGLRPVRIMVCPVGSIFEFGPSATATASAKSTATVSILIQLTLACGIGVLSVQLSSSELSALSDVAFVLLIANCVPCLPSDVGWLAIRPRPVSLLRRIIWLQTKLLTGWIIASAAIAIGVWVTYFGDVAWGMWILLLGLSGTLSVEYLNRALWIRGNLANKRVKDIMRISGQFVAVPHRMSVAAFIKGYVMKYKQREFVVMAGGNMMGQVVASELENVPGDTDILAIADSPRITLRPYSPALSALDAFELTSAETVLVLSKGKLVGVVYRQDLNQHG